MSSDNPSIYVIALEPSGDVLGARFIGALRNQTQSSVTINGVGGPAMSSAGLHSLFDPSDLAILGIFEVLPKAGTVLRRVGDVLRDIDRVQPDVLVTIDSWGFTGRVHKALAKCNSPIKRVRYVAPQLWAWRPGRAKQLAGWIDHILTLFPFEPPLFENHGLNATWVGHPVTEGAFSGNGARFRERYGIDIDTPVVSVLPGSRSAEVKALTPVFGETLTGLLDHLPALHVAVPTVPSVEPVVRTWAGSLSMPVSVFTGEEARDDAFAASYAALAASGTVTLELARANVPHVIAYKVNPFSAFAFKHLAKTSHVNLINVLLNETVIPECLQERCRADILTEEMLTLTRDETMRTNQQKAFQHALSALTPGGSEPSQKAAQVVLSLASGEA